MPTHGSLSKAGKIRSMNKHVFREVVINNERKLRYHKRKYRDPIRKFRHRYLKLKRRSVA